MTATAIRPTAIPQPTAFVAQRAVQPASAPAYANEADVRSRIDALVRELRTRDADPAYASAAVLDPYGRISANEEGVEEKTDRQLLDILTAMTRLPYRLGNLFVDNGRSAWKRGRKRPGWNSLLARIDSGASSGAFVWHIDRLMRQPYDLEKLIDLNEGRGVIIGSCYGTRDLSDSNDRFILRIEVANACKSSDDAQRRIKRDKQAAREAGLMDRKDVFGHKSRGVPREQVEREAEAILFGIQSIVDGWSWAEVADEWERRGIVSRNGLPMHPQKVRNILTLPRHAGLLTLGEGRKREILGKLANVEPIVPLALWEEFTAMLKTRERGRPRDTSGHLLSGMIRCECGRMMACNTTKVAGVAYRSYRCPASGCGQVSINADVAEEWARAHALDILSKPSHAKQIAKRSKELAAIDTKLAAKADARARLIARRNRDLITDDELDDSLAVIKTVVDELTRERAALVKVGAADSDGTGLTLAELEEEWKADESTTQEGRRGLLRSAMPLGVCVSRAQRRERRQTLANSAGRLSRIAEGWQPLAR